MSNFEVANPLPRELAPGLFWLGECLPVPSKDGLLHSGSSVYLVAGEKHSAVVDAGINHHIPVVMDQISSLMQERSLPDLRYAFVTHTEMPHSGGIGYVLDRYPDVTVHGDVSDLHLIFPEFADRLYLSDPGESLDLGGRELVVVEGVFRDLLYSRWAFDTKCRVLFSGDGFAFTHEHEASHCGQLAEDVPDLEIPKMMALFAAAAFYWTRFVDIEPLLERLDELIFEELHTTMILPAHGLPIGDPEATLPMIREGLRKLTAGTTARPAAPWLA